MGAGGGGDRSLHRSIQEGRRGEILDIIKVPPDPDFALFLQRARSDR
jgi:hypothetical protein